MQKKLNKKEEFWSAKGWKQNVLRDRIKDLADKHIHSFIHSRPLNFLTSVRKNLRIEKETTEKKTLPKKTYKTKEPKRRLSNLILLVGSRLETCIMYMLCGIKNYTRYELFLHPSIYILSFWCCILTKGNSFGSLSFGSSRFIISSKYFNFNNSKLVSFTLCDVDFHLIQLIGSFVI